MITMPKSISSLQLKPEDKIESDSCCWESYRFRVILPDGRSVVMMVPGITDGKWPSFIFDREDGIEDPMGLNLVFSGHYS